FSLHQHGSHLLKAILIRLQSDNHCEPRLVAVSKLKSKEYVIKAYECGQKHFGENYIQEMEEKSRDAEVLEKCPEIKWHFIGSIQRNKINRLLNTHNLYMIETISSNAIAEEINKKLEKTGLTLKVMVQVNTSGEENKSGIEPKDVTSLVSFILNNCPNLDFVGLMTIGAFDHDYNEGPNPDFQCLVDCRDEVVTNLKLEKKLELSMGMSNDFEHAIQMGSTNVRVGSTIFGARPVKS
ncbi:proline synthase co-transcribed bacterial protein-like protein, partial [Dinothrombium tinctorium]